MKKIYLLVLIAILATRSFAQVTFTLVSNPCDTNKVLAISYSGGTAPYTIQWYGGLYTAGSSTHTVTGLTDTLYHYDGASLYAYVYSGSVAIASGHYAGVPPAFTFTFAPNALYCGTMGTASVTVTGGTPPYRYYWYNGYRANNVVDSTNPDVLPSDIYGITIVDAAGCITGTPMQTSSSPSVSSQSYDTLASHATFSLSLSTTPANCTNGSVSLAGVSGSPVMPLSYLWSTGATSPSISGLVRGTYTLRATDATGCTAINNATVVQNTTINVNTSPTPATCLANDGAIIGFGSGGVPPYTYLWSNGATTQSQSGLYTGSLTLTVTDANGCIGTGTGTIGASTPITVTYAATASLCTAPTGTATITISGGTPPYTDTFFTSPLQMGVTATNLAPGSYLFHVRDAVGCIRSGSVVVPPIDVMSFNYTTTPALCTLSNGSINTSVTGGVAPLTYSWNTGATTSGITGEPSGSYRVIITDNNGCSITKYPYLGYTSPVTVSLSSTPASCIFTHDGVASAYALGGTAPYFYYWTNGGTTASITGLATGPYWVQVIDASGCVSPYDNNYDYVSYNAYDSTCLCVIKVPYTMI